jgi:hypothetical protein
MQIGRHALKGGMRTRTQIGLVVFLVALHLAHGEKALVAQACGGDCDVDGLVGLSEMVEGVSIGLGARPLSSCAAMDSRPRGGDRRVGIDDLLAAVENTLLGCPVPATGDGSCRRPGPAGTPPPGLVPCAPGSMVRVSRCDPGERERCLADSSRLVPLNFGSVGPNGNFSVGFDMRPGAAFVFEADVEPPTQTKYRVVEFGFLGGSGGLGAGTGTASLQVEISPSSDAATSLIDESGFDLFNGEETRSLNEVVRSANGDTDFAGLSAGTASALAAVEAGQDPTVQEVLARAVSPCGNERIDSGEACDPPFLQAQCSFDQVCAGDCTACVSASSCDRRCCPGRNDFCKPPNAECFCDDACVEFFDCCADFVQFCAN